MEAIIVALYVEQKTDMAMLSTAMEKMHGELKSEIGKFLYRRR